MVLLQQKFNRAQVAEIYGELFKILQAKGYSDITGDFLLNGTDRYIAIISKISLEHFDSLGKVLKLYVTFFIKDIIINTYILYDGNKITMPVELDSVKDFMIINKGDMNLPIKDKMKRLIRTYYNQNINISNPISKMSLKDIKIYKVDRIVANDDNFYNNIINEISTITYNNFTTFIYTIVKIRNKLYYAIFVYASDVEIIVLDIIKDLGYKSDFEGVSWK
jgi:hypothetical protein|nr:MAG TPA: hypothetical protein [Caudoviricetes sp.]